MQQVPLVMKWRGAATYAPEMAIHTPYNPGICRDLDPRTCDLDPCEYPGTCHVFRHACA